MRRELLRATSKWRWTWLVPLNDGWVGCKTYRCCAAAAVLALCWAAHHRPAVRRERNRTWRGTLLPLPQAGRGKGCATCDCPAVRRQHTRRPAAVSRRRLLSSSTGCLSQKTKLLVVRVTAPVSSTWKVSVPS